MISLGTRRARATTHISVYLPPRCLLQHSHGTVVARCVFTFGIGSRKLEGRILARNSQYRNFCTVELDVPSKFLILSAPSSCFLLPKPKVTTYRATTVARAAALRTNINIDGRPLPTKTQTRRRTSSKAYAPHLLHACSPQFHLPVT